MMMDYISLAGFVLSVFVAGVAVGRFAEKIERLTRRIEDEEHKEAHKNDRRQKIPDKDQNDRRFDFTVKGLAVYRQHLLYKYNNMSGLQIQEKTWIPLPAGPSKKEGL